MESVVEAFFFLWWKGGFQEVEYYANINEFDTFLIFNLKSTLKDKLFKKFFFSFSSIFTNHNDKYNKIENEWSKNFEIFEIFNAFQNYLYFPIPFHDFPNLRIITRFDNIRIHPFFLKIHIQFT